jgi:prefoldin subunit 5
MEFRKLKRVLIYGASGLVIFLLGIAIGASGSSGSSGPSGPSQKDINARMDELHKLNQQIDHLKQDLSDLQAKHKDAFEVIQNKAKVEAKLKQEQAQLDSMKSKLADLNSQISSKQHELKTVTGQVERAKGAPKILQAGEYTVGKDIPAGRYKATPVGSGSNFVVYGTDGTPVVNTILGDNGGIGVPSYTFECEDGYIIKTEAPAKLTPVK